MSEQDPDSRLRDLSSRRPTLTKAEWEELWRLVIQTLSNYYSTCFASLPEQREIYVQDFFQDKILKFGSNTQIDHCGALKVYFNRYLIDCLRDPYLKNKESSHAADDNDGEYPSGPVDAAADAASLEDYGRGELDTNGVSTLLDEVVAVVKDLLTGKQSGIEAQTLFTSLDLPLGIKIPKIVAAARQFLAGHGAWARLQPDIWWMRLYLKKHYCPKNGLALYALARQYQIPAYYYKAVKLGVTVPGGNAAALAAFQKSYRGQWLVSLGIPVDKDHCAETELALKILCLVSLQEQGTAEAAA